MQKCRNGKKSAIFLVTDCTTCYIKKGKARDTRPTPNICSFTSHEASRSLLWVVDGYFFPLKIVEHKIVLHKSHKSDNACTK